MKHQIAYFVNKATPAWRRIYVVKAAVIMRRFPVVFLTLMLLGCDQPRNEAVVYLQLVCGNDQDVPPTSEARETGQKLNDRLHKVFKYKHYWELKRELLRLRNGRKTRARICAEREVEVELLKSQAMAVRIYDGGQLTRTRMQPVDSAFVVAGWDKGPGQSWFIVVRRDRPLDPGT